MPEFWTRMPVFDNHIISIPPNVALLYADTQELLFWFWFTRALNNQIWPRCDLRPPSVSLGVPPTFYSPKPPFFCPVGSYSIVFLLGFTEIVSATFLLSNAMECRQEKSVVIIYWLIWVQTTGTDTHLLLTASWWTGYGNLPHYPPVLASSSTQRSLPSTSTSSSSPLGFLPPSSSSSLLAASLSFHWTLDVDRKQLQLVQPIQSQTQILHHSECTILICTMHCSLLNFTVLEICTALDLTWKRYCECNESNTSALHNIFLQLSLHASSSNGNPA